MIGQDPLYPAAARSDVDIEAEAATILSLLEATPDITIEELCRALREKGLSFGDATIRRFFKRHGITRKKRPPMPRNRTAPMY